MKITLLVIGKTDKKYLIDAIDEYCKRLIHYIKLEYITLPDIKNARNVSQEQLIKKEGELIISYMKSNCELYLLDENGKQFTSVEFARFIEKKQVAGQKDLVFVIGGAFGFAPEVKSKASGLISLSALTFSHQLVRLIFMEQLYRAMTIIKGEPYHHQ